MEAWEILCLCVAVEECVPAKVVRVLSNMAQMHVCTCARTHTHTHTHTHLYGFLSTMITWEYICLH